MNTKQSLSIVALVVILLATVPLVDAEDYHIQSVQKDEVYDISLNWSDYLGSKDWTTYTLWDEFSTHCYISFKFNVGASLAVPASLRLSYPSVVEPGQQFNVETSLNIAENREVSFSSEFFIKIDLDLPGVGAWIPGIGWVDSIKNTYGGTWEFKFNLNSKTVERLLNKIWLGDENSLESFSNALGLDSCVQIQDVNINSQTLGPLAYGSFKINFFKAILTAAKTLSNVAPPIAVVINALDWLFTNVIKVDTGLVITPTLSAEIVTPISPSSDLSLATTAVVFDEDISSKQTTSTVSYSAKETTNYNSVGLNYGPLVYRLSLTNNWNYYLDLDIDFLSLNIYQNSWSWNLGTFPSFSKEVSASTSQISCSAKLDEPLHATRSESNNGELSIGISDGSGVSNVALLYSTDKVSWERMDIQAQGGQYKAKPISSVQQDTTVYYFFEATDGDNDVYRIDNNGVYYTYLLKPEQTSGDSSFLDFGNTFSGFNLLFIIVAIIVIITIVCTFLLVKQRKKNRIL